jgi:RNA polymerase sigma-70 factor (ECF subfamily)
MEVVSEVLSETMFRAFRSFHTYNGASTFTTWCIAIARNVLRELKRKPKHAHVGSYNVYEELLLDDSTQREIEHSLSAERVEHLFTLMPENVGKIIRMLYDDCSYSEIGEFMNVPIGTVRSRINRYRTIAKQVLIDNAVCLN